MVGKQYIHIVMRSIDQISGDQNYSVHEVKSIPKLFTRSEVRIQKLFRRLKMALGTLGCYKLGE